jgi:hypothetical protein
MGGVVITLDTNIRRVILVCMRDGKTVGMQLKGDVLFRVHEHRVRLQVLAGSSVRVTVSDTLRDLIMIGLHAAESDNRKATQS